MTAHALAPWWVAMPAVAVSGFKIVVMGNGFARRNRFILSCALALGLGVTLAPQVSF